MNQKTPKLPDFANPPVVEVVLAIQFELLEQLKTVHLGSFWEKIKKSFPTIEEHPPHFAPPEVFGIPGPTKVDVKFEDKLPFPRIWFINDAGTQLIQVQQDFFAHNWRKVSKKEEYPRYGSIREEFTSKLQLFEEFLASEGLGRVVPNQCEVTYVNMLESGEGWERHGEIGKIVTSWTQTYGDSFLSEPEDLRIAIRYIIPDSSGKPMGRFQISIQPAYRVEDKKLAFDLRLTARGRPDGEGIDGVLKFLDTGHEWIVRGFASITSVHMHRIWGRRDNK